MLLAMSLKSGLIYATQSGGPQKQVGAGGRFWISNAMFFLFQLSTVKLALMPQNAVSLDWQYMTQVYSQWKLYQVKCNWQDIEVLQEVLQKNCYGFPHFHPD